MESPNIDLLQTLKTSSSIAGQDQRSTPLVVTTLTPTSDLVIRILCKDACTV